MKIDFKKLGAFPNGEALPALRCAIASALGRDKSVSQAYLGSLLGFHGSNIYTTMKRLEAGERGLQGGQILLGSMIINQCMLHFQELIVIPEWTINMPVYPAEDGGQIILTHNWFPKFQVLACPTEYAGFSEHGTHFGFVGSSEDHYDNHELYWSAELPLPNLADYAVFLAKATDIIQKIKEEDHADLFID